MDESKTRQDGDAQDMSIPAQIKKTEFPQKLSLIEENTEEPIENTLEDVEEDVGEMSRPAPTPLSSPISAKIGTKIGSKGKAVT